ncbi:hypothetical protein DFR33_105119 [Bradymonas sediminis]|uniref:Uncharacterized protein n=2 Tax=Bradymonas sediminis TaxID=1548548 RepID=A0A2Z4FQL8_9DELT|nr:hypothetical protein DN745_18570 [Bradymonas sediminis]TDP73787.1 hypothetical protein DFR33_105119 [Bradymonas sediminis]
MTYEEFEWNLLKLAYEDGLKRFQPSFVAYTLGLPHEVVTAYLEQAAQAGLLEMDITDDGRLEYFIPGIDPDTALPEPVWKREFGGSDDESGQREAAQNATDHDGLILAAQPQLPAAPPMPTDGFVSAEDSGEDGVEPYRPPDRQAFAAADAAQSRPPSAPTDGGIDFSAHTRRASVAARGAYRSQMPSSLRAHIQARQSSEDGSLSALERSGVVAVLDRHASVHDDAPVMVGRQLVKADSDGGQLVSTRAPEHFPARVETNLDTYSDPSKTIFMRQLKVYGVPSEEALRAHVERLFTSLGYQPVQVNQQRLRFERGSVTFILALIPLFVLVLPLFVYLFLYLMGRSTIQQEPVELDVQLRQLPEGADVYELDLTFIGMHGVVLGAADQRVLNQEVDTLRDELQWALSAS